MSDEQVPTASPDDVRPVTSEKIEVPDIPQPGQWVMPKPVFRQSSGRLPQGFEKQYGQADGSNGNQASGGAATATAVALEPPGVETADVAPQPDVGEEVVFTAPEVAPPPVKTRSRAMRITLIVLGLLAMAAFVAVFLAVVYFLFFSPNESQVF
jgi:hypothetical protein